MLLSELFTMTSWLLSFDGGAMITKKFLAIYLRLKILN